MSWMMLRIVESSILKQRLISNVHVIGLIYNFKQRKILPLSYRRSLMLNLKRRRTIPKSGG